MTLVGFWMLCPSPIFSIIPVFFLLLSCVYVVLWKNWLYLESVQSSLSKTSISPFLWSFYHNLPQWLTKTNVTQTIFFNYVFNYVLLIRFWVHQNHLLGGMLKIQIQRSISEDWGSLGISVFNRAPGHSQTTEVWGSLSYSLPLACTYICDIASSLWFHSYHIHTWIHVKNRFIKEVGCGEQEVEIREHKVQSITSRCWQSNVGADVHIIRKSFWMDKNHF